MWRGTHGRGVLFFTRRNEQLRGCPIELVRRIAIAVTASAMTEDRKRILEAGFEALQTKPIQVREFVKVVGDTIARVKGTAA